MQGWRRKITHQGKKTAKEGQKNKVSECSEPKMIKQHNPSIGTAEALRVSIISLVISGWRS